jgi:uncharacterized membrane protein YraQ (UPF0718 family)
VEIERPKPRGDAARGGSGSRDALIRSARGFLRIVPILLGVLLLIALANALVPKDFYARIFTGNCLLDPIVGAAFGSIAGGNPLTSYVIGGELLKQGVSLLAVTAFLLSWVTVGLIQIPAEAASLGRRFSILRNLLSFLFALGIAVLTALILEVFS